MRAKTFFMIKANILEALTAKLMMSASFQLPLFRQAFLQESHKQCPDFTNLLMVQLNKGFGRRYCEHVQDVSTRPHNAPQSFQDFARHFLDQRDAHILESTLSLSSQISPQPSHQRSPLHFKTTHTHASSTIALWSIAYACLNVSSRTPPHTPSLPTSSIR